MKTILLVTYKEEKTIEGYAEDEEDFKEWLKAHNKDRARDGNEPEKEFEFERKPIKHI